MSEFCGNKIAHRHLWLCLEQNPPLPHAEQRLPLELHAKHLSPTQTLGRSSKNASVTQCLHRIDLRYENPGKDLINPGSVREPAVASDTQQVSFYLRRFLREHSGVSDMLCQQVKSSGMYCWNPTESVFFSLRMSTWAFWTTWYQEAEINWIAK